MLSIPSNQPSSIVSTRLTAFYTKFFRPFSLLHSVKKQNYKLKLAKKWKIHKLFYILLLEQNIIKKERVEKIPKLDANNDNCKKYKMETIWDSIVYVNNLELDHLLGF